MSLDSIYANSLWWVQFHLQGGWRRHLGTVVIYAALAVTLSAVITRAGPNLSPARLAGMWLTVLPVLHGSLLLLLGGSSIRRAVQRDFTTGMIESHRLTPMSGLTTALGYVIGPNIQALVLFVCGWTTGMFFCLWAPYPVWDWCVTMAVLLWLALVMWSIFAVLALSTAGSVNLLMIAVLGGIAVGRFMLPAIPGIGMLLGLPYWRFGPPAGLQAVLEDTTLLPLLLQAALLATCLAATARKYRRNDIRAFSPELGLLLVLELTLLGAFGIRDQSTFPRFATMGAGALGDQMTASILVTTLFAFIPISAAAQAAATASPRNTRRASELRLAGACLVAVVVVAGVHWLLLSDAPALRLRTDARTWKLTTLFVALALLPGGAIMQLFYRWRERVVWLLGAWLFATWVLPPAVHMTLLAVMDVPAHSAYQWIPGLSPAGALLMVWDRSAGELWPGIMTQVTMCLAVWASTLWLRPARDVDLEHEEVMT